MKYRVTKTTTERLGFFKQSGKPILDSKTAVLYEGGNIDFATELFGAHIDKYEPIFPRDCFQVFEVQDGKFKYAFKIEAVAGN